MKMLNKFILLAVTALVLSACGKNNKVGNAGVNNGLLVNGSGIYSSGMIGNDTLDRVISRINCNTGTGNNRVYMSFFCSNGGCNMGQVNSYQQMAAASLRLGVTPTGDIAIAYFPNPQSLQISFLMCQDALFNQNTLGSISIAALQILNQNVSSNTGSYGQFIANVLFRIANQQYGNPVQINAPFTAIPPQYFQ